MLKYKAEKKAKGLRYRVMTKGPKAKVLDKCTEISPNVYLGTVPRTDEDVKALAQKGITNIINILLPYEYERFDKQCNLDKLYEENKMNELRLNVKDHTEPPVAYLRTAVEYLLRKVAAGESTYVHCYGGHGRSAALVFAYKMVVQTTEAQEKEIQSFFNQMKQSSDHKVRESLYTQKNIMDFKNHELEGLRTLQRDLLTAKKNLNDEMRNALNTVREQNKRDVEASALQNDKDVHHKALPGKLRATQKAFQQENHQRLVDALNAVPFTYNVYADEVTKRIPLINTTAQKQMVQVVQGAPSSKKEKFTEAEALAYEEESKKQRPIAKDQDYYAILDIAVTATQEEVKTAYTRARTNANGSDERLKIVEGAYEVLCTEATRAKYDMEHNLNTEPEWEVLNSVDEIPSEVYLDEDLDGGEQVLLPPPGYKKDQALYGDL